MPGSVHGFALVTAAGLTFLFTDREAAITMNSIKNRNHAIMSCLADRTATHSTIGILASYSRLSVDPPLSVTSCSVALRL